LHTFDFWILVLEPFLKYFNLSQRSLKLLVICPSHFRSSLYLFQILFQLLYVLVLLITLIFQQLNFLFELRNFGSPSVYDFFQSLVFLKFNLFLLVGFFNCQFKLLDLILEVCYWFLIFVYLIFLFDLLLKIFIQKAQTVSFFLALD